MGTTCNQYVDAQPASRIDFDGKFGISDVSLTAALAEGILAGGWDVIFQLLTGNGTIDWGEVGFAFGIGAAGGLVGHFARASFYTKNTAARRAWEQADGSFVTYFTKCMGFATSTSGQAGGRMFPIWRSLTSGAAARVFGLMYNSYIGFYGED